jgi:carboxylesterase type B
MDAHIANDGGSRLEANAQCPAGMLQVIAGRGFFFQSSMDGSYLTLHLSSFAKESSTMSPFLIGNVAEETSWIYQAESMNIHTEEDYINTVKANYDVAMATQLLNVYPARDYPSPRQAYNAISADHWFVCPARKLIRAVSVSQLEFVGRFLTPTFCRILHTAFLVLHMALTCYSCSVPSASMS